MGIDKKSNIKMYWQKGNYNERFCLRNPFMINAMSYSRYTFIRGHFRLLFMTTEKMQSLIMYPKKQKKLLNLLINFLNLSTSQPRIYVLMR